MPEENSVPPQRFIRTFQTDLAKVQGNEPAGPVALPESTNVAPTPPVSEPKTVTPVVPAPQPVVPQVPPMPPKPVISPVPQTSIPTPPQFTQQVPVPPKPIQQPVPPPMPKPVPPEPPAAPVSQPVPSKPVISSPSLPPLSAPPPAPAAVPKAPLPNPLPVREEVQMPSATPEKEAAPAPLHTFTSDFSSLFKHRKASVATIIAAQQDAERAAPELYPKPKSHRTLVYMIVGGVLLVLGVVAALYAYGAYLTKNMPVALTPVAPAPIFVDERAQISGSGPQLLDAILQSVATPISSGHVRLLYTAESLSGTSTVFASLQLPAPGRVLRNLKTDGAMAGVVQTGGAQSPFFILPVSSYGETFAGMLSWETSMKNDLASLFPALPPLPVATTTASSTPPKKGSKVATTTPPAPVYIPGFKDEIIANHDARVYRDDANRVVLVYGYWNQSTFVIARDADAFTEILQRLATSRTE